MSALGSTSNPWSTRSLAHHDVAPIEESRLTPRSSDDLLMPRTCRFAPFDEHFNVLLYTSRWQQRLDAHLTHVFSPAVLSHHPIDDVARRTLQTIVDDPSQPVFAWRLRALACAVCTHWARLQCRYKNPHVCAPDVVALISRIARHLGRASIAAPGTFVLGLQQACIERLELTWRWYVAVVFPGVPPVYRKNMFMRMMTIVTMVGYLFRGGRLGHDAVLNGLRYVGAMSPWPDAVAIVYAFLHELGPTFALERAASHFVHRFLAELTPLTVGRPNVDPLCQLVSAINALVAEWRDGTTSVTLYHTSPVGDNHAHAYHSQS